MTATATFDYPGLARQCRALLAGEHDAIANAANFSALLYHSLPDVNWVGFYFLRDGQLVVGPFQGQPACVRIALGSGVCGEAAIARRTLVVPDVHEFDGHIACDPVSRSEIVVPLVQSGELIGVLDIDSPSVNRFSVDDAPGVEALAAVYLDSLGDGP